MPETFPLPRHAPPAADPPPVARLDDVWKRYWILTRHTPRLGFWVFNKVVEHLRRTPFEALRGVSFEVRHGGRLIGIIGPNGSGKSTLLKILAGITPPTRGVARLRGRVASLLEAGVGFHPELTGMENIFYQGAMYGLGRQAMLERLPAIIQFSGLERFLYEPVKHYSSGMYARLGCSVALHLDPDVALVDEILSVGDAEFRARVHTRLRRMIDDTGMTVFLVTHEVSTAAALCDELVWLDGGRIRDHGHPERVRREYERDLARRRLAPGHFLREALERFHGEDGSPSLPAGSDPPSRGDPRAPAPAPECGPVDLVAARRFQAEIVSARLVDGSGRALAAAVTGGEARLEATVRARADMPDALLRVSVWRRDGLPLADHLAPAVAIGAGQTRRWRLCWAPVVWMPGEVLITLAVVERGAPDRAVSPPWPTLTLRVEGPRMPDPEVPHLPHCAWATR